MSKTPAQRPKPRPKSSRKAAPPFQSRVDYVAKALRRGSWGARFDECFEHHDGNHVIAAVMLRAQRNPALKDAIVSAFEVASWDQVPWHDHAAPFAGMSARQIGLDAEVARKARKADFKDLYRHPEKMFEAGA